jgi:hypothetical protein
MVLKRTFVKREGIEEKALDTAKRTTKELEYTKSLKKQK